MQSTAKITFFDCRRGEVIFVGWEEAKNGRNAFVENAQLRTAITKEKWQNNVNKFRQ